MRANAIKRLCWPSFHFKAMVIIILVYIAGLLLSHAMLRVETIAEKSVYTKGARALVYALSLLSWLMVLITLITSWIDKIHASGYWEEPVNVKEIQPEPVKQPGSE